MNGVEKNYDVVVIGGGPAGSSMATYLRQLGHTVAVFEKDRFPRHHVGESLIPYCYNKLQEMGVLDDIRKFSSLKPGINFVDADGKRQSNWCFSTVLKGDSGISFHCMRAPFDKALLDNAKRLGADVFESHKVKSTDLSDPGRVAIEGTNDKGEPFSCEARFLVDASGQGSFLAKKLNTKTSYKGLDRVAFFTHWKNNQYDAALSEGMIKLVYATGEKKGWFWVIPVGKNHLSIGVSLQNDYVKQRKKELEAEGFKENWLEKLYMGEIESTTVLKPILENAYREHDVLSMSDYSYYSEQKFGDNYAMIGDSGAFLDPIFSSGIYVAFESACLVSKAISKQLHMGAEEGQRALAKTYDHINEGYKLIEKFVRLFYTPDVINFSHLGSDDDFMGKEKAYSIFHMMLSGDFFNNASQYSAFIDSLKDERTYGRFLEYYKKRGNKDTEAITCGYSFEQIYGHISEEYDWHEIEAGMKAG